MTASTTPTPDDHTQRRARQLRRCERLAELGMELVEAAHRAALRELQPPPSRRAPGMPDPTPYRSTGFSELFVELSHCVRQAILLEGRLDAGACDRPLPGIAPATHPSRDDAAAPAASPRPSHPGDHTRLAHERVEDDPVGQARRSTPEILAEICDELGRATDIGLTNLPRTGLPAPPRPDRSDTGSRRDPPSRPSTKSLAAGSAAMPATTSHLAGAGPPPRRPAPD